MGDGYCSNCIRSNRSLASNVERFAADVRHAKLFITPEDVNTEDIFGNPTNGSGWPVKLSTMESGRCRKRSKLGSGNRRTS